MTFSDFLVFSLMAFTAFFSLEHLKWQILCLFQAA